jgi:hypothetical protein
LLAIVTVASRAAPVLAELARIVTVSLTNEPLPIRLEGVIVSHDGILSAFHVVLDVMFMLVLLLDAEVKLTIEEDTLSLAVADCVTVIVRVIPPPETVTLPVREEEPVF